MIWDVYYFLPAGQEWIISISFKRKEINIIPNAKGIAKINIQKSSTKEYCILVQ